MKRKLSPKKFNIALDKPLVILGFIVNMNDVKSLKDVIFLWVMVQHKTVILEYRKHFYDTIAMFNHYNLLMSVEQFRA